FGGALAEVGIAPWYRWRACGWACRAGVEGASQLALQDENRRRPPRAPQLDRRLVPDQRELVQPHAHRRHPDLRGAAAALRRSGRARARKARPGSALSPTARRAAAGGRTAALG